MYEILVFLFYLRNEQELLKPDNVHGHCSDA